MSKVADKIPPEKVKPVIEALLSQECNKICADCHAKAPRWTSTNLGVFICIKCAGIHRSMGTHISKVKSVSLDSWYTYQLEVIRLWCSSIKSLDNATNW